MKYTTSFTLWILVFGCSVEKETSGEEADAVLGNLDLAGTQLTDGNQGFTLRGVGVFGDKLFVSDTNEASGISRVLRYQLSNLP